MCAHNSAAPQSYIMSTARRPSRCTALAPVVIAILSVLLSTASGTGVPGVEWGKTYHGKGTYYGVPPMAPNTHVHCHLPNIEQTGNYGGGITRTIAINADMYGNSRACGMCVKVWGNGRVCPHGNDPGDNSCGLGANPIESAPFLAVVTDELWERHGNDIDIGVHGDGHWGVWWHPIPCPWAKTNSKIALHAGGNPHYMKVQFRYLDSPMKSVTLIQGNGHRETSNYRFHDNFFVFNSGHYDGNSIKFEAYSTMGTKYCGKIDSQFKAEPYEYNAYPC